MAIEWRASTTKPRAAKPLVRILSIFPRVPLPHPIHRRMPAPHTNKKHMFLSDEKPSVVVVVVVFEVLLRILFQEKLSSLRLRTRTPFTYPTSPRVHVLHENNVGGYMRKQNPRFRRLEDQPYPPSPEQLLSTTPENNQRKITPPQNTDVPRPEEILRTRGGSTRAQTTNSLSDQATRRHHISTSTTPAVHPVIITR